ncbi:MAG: pentapeptide repeat-containing protein [Acidimicrobiia bacterium]
MAATGEEAKPPKPPVLPDAPVVAVDLADLDELYPDIDGLEADGAILALPEARTLDLLRSRLRACALDMASWRLARVRRVAVLGGRIEGLDATAAQLDDVTLSGVSLEDVVLERARCERVDLTGADVSSVTAVATLAGATISAAQAVALAARMARSLGVRVRVPDDARSGFPPSR